MSKHITTTRGYPDINKGMFTNDWNARVLSSKMAVTYGLKTISRVLSYSKKLRKEGYKLIRRNNKRTIEYAK